MADNTILTSGGFKPTTPNTPLDERTVVATRNDIANIDNPFLSMKIWIADEGVEVRVTKLTNKEIGGIVIENGAIDLEEGLKSVADEIYEQIQEEISEKIKEEASVGSNVEYEEGSGTLTFL